MLLGKASLDKKFEKVLRMEEEAGED